jgi:alkaline phosphatase D
MSSIRQPRLGPIVGHTTSNTCRLWIKAGDPGDNGGALAEDRRSIGVITVLKSNGEADPNDPKRTNYFRLHREYDRTGTFTLGEEKGLNSKGQPFVLTPNTTYRVRMGTLALDDVLDNDDILEDGELANRLPDPGVWVEELMNLPEEKSEAVFKTFPKSTTNTLSFILGSCRYPGFFWKKKKSDRIFKSILEHIMDNPYKKEPKFLLMMGDQIYADTLHRIVPLGLADTYEEFQNRYLDAFGSKNMRKVLRSVPNYMILDDHEIEDNWTQDRINKDKKRELFHLAIGAYMSYQWSHGPKDYEGRLFYKFECGGYPFFVLDERTQRFKFDDEDSDKNYEEKLLNNHLLGRPSFIPEKEPSQLDHLCNWLSLQQKNNKDRPKFIVSPTVFAPNPVDTIESSKQKNKSDSWSAFPITRKRLLGHIVDNKIQNVVFLSGDVHCSNVAKMTFSGSEEAEKLKAYSITSSAFYWPFWFADGEPSSFVHDSKKQNDTFEIDDEGKIRMDYTASNFTQKDNFCQVDVDWPRKKLEVRAIDKEGSQIVKTILKLA